MSAASASTSHSWPPHSLHERAGEPGAGEQRAEVADRRGHAAVGVVEVPELQVERADERQDAAQVARRSTARSARAGSCTGCGSCGGTAPDRSSSTTAPRRRGVAPFVRRGGSGGPREMPPSASCCEVARRQRGHQHADVDEQAHARVVEPGDHLDRRRRSSASPGVCWPWISSYSTRSSSCSVRQEPSQEGLAGLADRQSDAGGAHAARGMQLGEQEGQALGLVAPLRRTEPVVEARPDDAHAAAGGVEIAPQRVDLVVGGDGERPPQLARFELDDVGAMPSVTIPTARSGAGRSARITSGVQLKALAARVQAAGSSAGTTAPSGQATSRATDGSEAGASSRRSARCGTAG